MLFRSDAGHVQQSFSQGRKKTVVVEKKKKRVITRPGAKAPAVAKAVVAPVSTPPKAATPKPVVAKRGRAGSGNARPQRTSGGGASDKLLSNAEMDARTRALQMARERDVVEAAQKIENDAARAEQEKLDAIEHEKQAVIEAANPKVEPAKPSVVAKKPAAPKTPKVDQASAEAQAEKRGEYTKAKTAPQGKDNLRDRRPKLETPSPSRTKGDNRGRSRKLTIQNALDEGGRQRSLASLKRRQQKQRRAAASSGPAEKISREVILPDTITIQELANRMTERSVDVIKFLMKQGQMRSEERRVGKEC